ncbi:MAG: tetratricopeptide repeat protein [bacterium]
MRSRAYAGMCALAILSILTASCTPRGKPDPLRIPDSVRERFVRGKELYVAQKFEGAEAEFKWVVREAPRFANGRFMLGKTYFFQEKMDLAEREFREALKINPYDLESRYWLGRIKSFKPETVEEAVEEFKKILEMYEDHPRARRALAQIYERQGKIQEALVEYRRALSTEPSYAVIHYDLGNLYRRIGLEDRAEEEYRRATLLDPDFKEAQNALARYRKGK